MNTTSGLNIHPFITGSPGNESGTKVIHSPHFLIIISY